MRDITLDHRYAATTGQVLVTGIQALARLPLDKSRLDHANGLHTAGFISGYRGSPLGGYDQELAHARTFLGSADVVFQPGVNEELAATAIWGSQQVNSLPGAKYDGVFGIWYGKSPGVDRAVDAMRHANAAGTSPHGGVLVLAGDDPECKSSTLPSQSEYSLIHCEIPVLSPSSLQDVLDYGIIGLAMSRYSGCWVGLICTTDLMDSSGVIEVGIDRYAGLPVRDLAAQPSPYIRPNDSPQAQEGRMRLLKVPAALEFARAVQLNRIAVAAPRRRLGLISAGRAYGETLQALRDLGLDGDKAAEQGISLFKLGMIWPFDHQAIRDFAAGHDDILVIEDKRDLIETQIKESLFNLPGERRPRVSGKRDADGKPLLANAGVVMAADIAAAIAALLPAGAVRHAAPPSAVVPSAAEESRDPFFCSGCPHNRSTKTLPGAKALAGIGCHYMARWINPDTAFFSQMGGEGVQWVGAAPFTDMPHIFANLGDGTYFHSGILAIRQAVAAKAHITYKLLYNDAVAMTGGQHVDGPLDVPTITRQLAAEGVAMIAVVTEDPGRYVGAALAPGVKVHPREALQDVERALRQVNGVTALIYDQVCATEKRRRRKRGLLAEAETRVVINDLVCEGCGDCSAKSNCISVEPLETHFGRKRQINQSSCNKDFSCVEGFCPSFVTLKGATPRQRQAAVLPVAGSLPAPPVARLSGPYNILISGIGGLGVTTLSGILAMAAHLDGRAVHALNRTGLAQKGGAVTSHVRIAETDAELPTSAVPPHGADLHLAYDMIVAAGSAAIVKSAADRTATVVNSHLNPTSAFVRDTAKRYDTTLLESTLAKASREIGRIDARRLAEVFLGNELFANMIMLGFAVQKGWSPVSLAALERAIVLNGAAALQNRQALDLGRLSAARPDIVADALARAAGHDAAPDSTLEGLIARRRDYLSAYKDDSYSRRYATLVEAVRATEAARIPGQTKLTEAVARGAFAAMLIKDEYEVARLLTDPEFAAKIRADFTGDITVSYNLAPALLAKPDPATGAPRKITFGPWLTPVLKLVAKLKGLRESPLDPLRLDPLRRRERKFRDDYIARMEHLLTRVGPHNHTLACEIAALPLEAKGYGHVKARALADVEARLARTWTAFLAAEPEAARAAG